MNTTVKGVSVRLTHWEMLLAAQAGVMRQVENRKLGRQPAFGADRENDWQLNIEGCLGECALAKFLGVYWNGKGKFKAPDVGEVDVRTRSKNHYDLIIRKPDPDDRIFWLLCGLNGTYSIKGWILCRDGKKDEFLGSPNSREPAYFVPQTALNPPGSGNV